MDTDGEPVCGDAVMLKTQAKTKAGVAIDLKMEARRCRRRLVSNSAPRSMRPAIAGPLLSAEVAAQNPVDSDLDICFVPSDQTRLEYSWPTKSR